MIGFTPKRQKQGDYTEPDVLPADTVKIRFLGPGDTIIKDFRAWPVRLKPGETIIVTTQTWKNLQDPTLPKAGRWEKVG